MTRPRAASVTAAGVEDGWTPTLGYSGEIAPSDGVTRLVITAPAADLPRVHQALVRALRPPLGLLWRRHVDRLSPPKNPSSPGQPRDFVALERPAEAVLDALGEHAGIVYEDARAELWIRGRFGEQLVLDQDGTLFVYPDDPAFRDALDALGVPDREVVSLERRDYVKHWYHAENDAQELGLFARLGMAEVPHRKG